MSSVSPPPAAVSPQTPSLLWPIISGATIFAAVLMALLVGPQVGSVLFMVGLIGGIVSIVQWAIYFYRKWATSTKAKTAFWIAHGLVLFAATIPANIIFDLAIGLPMSDFPFAGRVAHVMGIILTYLTVLLFVMFCGFMAVNFASCPSFPWAKSTSRAFALVGLGLGFFGGMVVCGICAAMIALGSEQLLLGSAYLADCGILKRYPGVTQDGRSRLHENGIVSTIRFRDGRFVVTVGTIADARHQ